MPHEWFLHFYLTSVVCSIFWGAKIARKTALVVSICENVQPGGEMSMNQIAIVWSLMTVQGVRRLAESIAFRRSSSSRMWFVHWILGIWFYFAMSFAVWIEGAGMLFRVETRCLAHWHGLLCVLGRDFATATIPSAEYHLFGTFDPFNACHTFIHPCIGHPTRLSCILGLATKIHTSQPSNLPHNGLPPLHSRMRHLSILGSLGSTRGSMVQHDYSHCLCIRGYQPGRYSFDHEGMVHRKVWKGQGGIQMDNDTICLLKSESNVMNLDIAIGRLQYCAWVSRPPNS